MVFVNNHEHDDSCPDFDSEGRDMSLIWVCDGSEWVASENQSHKETRIPKEVRTTSTTGGEKGVKQERFDLIPVEALSTVAQLYGKGAAKYAEHNWRKGYEWSKSYAALQRHANLFWNGEDIDEEMQLPHMAAVIFHALALITFMKEQPGFDDRFKVARGFSTEATSHSKLLTELMKPEVQEQIRINAERQLRLNHHDR